MLLLIYCVTLFPVIVYLVICIIREKEKYKKGKYATILLIYLFGYFLMPFYKIIDILPFEHNNIDKAFKFDYNDAFNRERYELIFKKKYKNTYFIVGRELNTDMYNQEIFNCYSKNKNGWRPIIQIFDYETGFNDDSDYDIYYCNNKKDNLTGIFITTPSSLANINDKFKIEDKYGTRFEYIKDDKAKPIKYMNNKNYIYFGIVNHNIDDNDYYIKIKGKKVILK